MWQIKLQMKLEALLCAIAGTRGQIITEMPFRAVAENELRGADVAFISRSRWDEAGDYLMGAPELVIEILSPSNVKPQLREYAALCLANGCIDFWIVDQSSKTVTVTGQSGQSIRYSSGMTVPLPWLGETSLAVDLIFGQSLCVIPFSFVC
jgi:Uma2 family endonuclease